MTHVTGPASPRATRASETTSSADIATPGVAPDPDSFDGRTVKKAEKLLKQLGFHPGNVDREYTANTEAAVKSFQSARGLDPTGNLDVRTLNAMRRAAKDKAEGVQSAGQQSASIEKQERRLKRLGYDVGSVDGTFDRQTGRAVRAFKKDQGIKQAPEKLGKRGREVLGAENRALNHAPRRARVKRSEQRARLDHRVERAAERVRADGSEGFGRGTRGLSVKVVQGHLKSAGYDPKHRNGVFDERTEAMVEQFQKTWRGPRGQQLAVSGRVDAATWKALKTSTIEARGAADPKQMIGERSSAVKSTEKMLKKLGLSTGRVDGLYTKDTERAVDRFRRRKGMGTFDGVGNGTLRAIRKAYKKKMNPVGRGRRATGYVNGVPRRIRVVPLEGSLVEVRTAKAYLKMKSAAARDGINLDVVSGFRTMDEQRRLYNGWINRLPGFNPAAPPGFSNHQSGIALDLNTQGVSQSVGTGPVYNWLARNAGRFGFGRIPSEHWHWEFRR